MDIAQLARRRAECAALLEELSGHGPGGDSEENREMAIAVSRANAAYIEAEQAFQKAASLLTTSELANMGITA